MYFLYTTNVIALLSLCGVLTLYTTITTNNAVNIYVHRYTVDIFHYQSIATEIYFDGIPSLHFF